MLTSEEENGSNKKSYGIFKKNANKIIGRLS